MSKAGSSRLPQGEQGKKKAGAASYSGAKRLAPLAGQNSLRRAKVALVCFICFLLCVKSRLESVAARRARKKESGSGKLFGKAEPGPVKRRGRSKTSGHNFNCRK